MPIRYKIYPQEKFIWEQFSGMVTMADIHDITPEIWADPAYNTSLNALIDMSKATLNMSHEEVITLGQFFLESAESAQGKVALVTNKTVDTALGMIYKSKMASKNDTQIFSTLEAACNYLKIELQILDFGTIEKNSF